MKKAIIIGASSGIGRELAKILSKNEWKVAVTGRRTALLEELTKTYPGMLSSTFDINNHEDAIVKVEELVKQLGGLDLLVISSGTGDLNEKLDFTIEKNTIDTNVLGFTCLADWAFSYFRRNGGGHMVGISSIGGLRGSGIAPAYNASKAYQINYMEGLRQKANKMKSPVCVTDIRPGLVSTPMAKGDGLFWVMPVEKVATQMYKAIMKKKKVVYVTKRWAVLAAIIRRLPRALYERM